ncbi:recombinase family protein [Parvularcula flava]|uniref:Recombinase RecB n=1 Tax=Aquisalinus luteolus TaxID=1566827 RepID=A0A8J3ESB5_9PROT|nr:recombinase family protein [Aquisalinus luteolus]NHK29677.1 recombinase family protein [Aquisalinus luteolus]GGI02135.1 recombinase RecB [Aquisalinus luteolus]
MKKAAIYARVSTGKQAAGELSIPDQISRCEEYARARDYAITQHYIDPGVSARSDKRPEFQRMIRECTLGSHPVDAVLVHSQSRFARNTRDLLVYSEMLKDHDIQLHSITQDVGEGDTADIMRTMLGAFDEYQSKETSKHVSRSMIENARQGFWNGAQPPFGYRTYVAETRGARAKKKIEIDAQEAEIVRLVFRLYFYGDGKSGPLGVKQTVSWLNENGFVNRAGKAFRVQFVDKILRNPAYIGEHYFNRRDSRRGVERPKEEWVPFQMPRIVEDAVFYSAQEKLDRQHPLKTPPRLVRSDVLLTSIATCAKCGSPLRKQSGKSGQYHYYKCSRKSDTGETGCSGVSIPMSRLDDAVIDTLEEKLLNPARLRKLTETLVARASERSQEYGARAKRLDGDRRKAKSQVQELYRLIGTGELAMDASLSAHIKGLQDGIETLNRQIAYVEDQRAAPCDRLDDVAIDRFGRAVSTALRDRSNPAFAKAYIQSIISDIRVSENEIRISGPKAALLEQASAFSGANQLVPSFAQEWRTSQENVPTPAGLNYSRNWGAGTRS